ncbi:hypothetical protein GNI_022670 [Gregarina niphandrodes]|uniref:Uncharacterized protein n=1 Tax=Gregarina niphandrodes TaxID=110365 RepID=A0A023BBV9_GRENI|nr:hypothetical protein GNI_022670 [Gregarina niphandrodes]EZG80137.1 hypothetical protein GNI_022670 [Gregarina niphandrodes]|eukprot:XP_011134333.1 hypothetical protein GNI_022670 [Gregarina niphandrodes]
MPGKFLEWETNTVKKPYDSRLLRVVLCLHLVGGAGNNPIQQFLIGALEPDVNHLLKRKHMLE